MAIDPFAAAQLSGIPYEGLYHVGLVVPDIEQAMADFGRQFGMTWSPRRTFEVSVRRPGGPVESLPVQATYSRQGPPFFELIEAIGEGIWAPSMAGGLHHLGLYVEDVEQEIRRLEREGFTLETHGVGAGGELAGPVYLSNAHRVRVELAASTGRDLIHAWVTAE